MSIDRLRAHYGFERMPFSKDLAPGMLHGHRAHHRPSHGSRGAWPSARSA